jgi:hypothetical protein
VDQGGSEVFADELVGGVAAARLVDQVGAGVGRGGGVEPVADASDPPAGFIAGDVAGTI